MDNKLIEIISNTDLFKDISVSDIPHLLKCFDCKVTEYKKDEYIAIAGDKFTGVGLILKGNVAITKEDLNGNQNIITILKKGDTFGEVIAFTDNTKWPSSVVSQNDCHIMIFHPEQVIGVCNNACSFHKTLVRNMLRIISIKAQILNKKLEYLTIKSIRGKLCRYILDCYKINTNLIVKLPLNREELANFLNVTRPSLSRELCKMRNERIIDFHKENITILDLELLIYFLE